MCNIITCIDTYKIPLRAPWVAKLKGCIPWPFCNTKLKQRESTADNPAHRAPIINMLISMFQLLKMILGTTYWIFNLQIINQIGSNGSAQWGSHVSWWRRRLQTTVAQVLRGRVVLLWNWVPDCLLRASGSRGKVTYFPYVCMGSGRDKEILY